MRRLVALVALSACRPDEGLALTCERDENALRATCAVSGAVAPLFVSVVTDEGQEGFAEVGDATTLSVARLGALQDVTVSVLDGRGNTGSDRFATGELPFAASITAIQQGDDMPVDLLTVAGCGEPYAVVLNPQGQVVWYENLAVGLPEGIHEIKALTVSDAGDIAAIIDRRLVRVIDRFGRIRLDVPAVQDRALHHDLAIVGDHIYVVDAIVETIDEVDFVMDGITTIEGGNVVDRWALADVLQPDSTVTGLSPYWFGEFPGALDWAHTNSIHVTQDGDWVISLFEQDLVLKIGGPAAGPTSGKVIWTLAGAQAKLPASDFAVVDANGEPVVRSFSHQHHPNVAPDGTLLLFDNGRNVDARGLFLRMNEDDGVATVTAAVDLAMSCPIGGALYPIAGGAVATCAPERTAIAIEAGAVTGTLALTCDSGRAGGGLMARAIPMVWDTAPTARP